MRITMLAKTTATLLWGAAVGIEMNHVSGNHDDPPSATALNGQQTIASSSAAISIPGLDRSPIAPAGSAVTIASSRIDDSIRSLVAEYKTAAGNSPDSQAEIRTKLFDTTKSQLVEMEANRNSQVAALEKRIAELKRVLELRASSLDLIAENRVKHLLGETADLDWSWGIPNFSNETGNGASPKEKAVASIGTDRNAWDQLGIQVVAVYSPVLSGFNDDEYKGGLVIKKIRPGSLAEKAFAIGDILVGVMDWQTPKLESLNWIMGQSTFQNASSVKIYLVREGKRLTVQIPRREMPSASVASTKPSSLSEPSITSNSDDLVALGYGMALLELKEKRDVLQRQTEEKSSLLSKLADLKSTAKRIGEKDLKDNSNATEFQQTIEKIEALSAKANALSNQIETTKSSIESLETRLEPVTREIERIYSKKSNLENSQRSVEGR